MVKKILVPVDGSEASKKAAEKAIDIAKRYDSQITFITVVTIPNMYRRGEYYYTGESDIEHMMERNLQAGTKMFDAFIDELELEGINYEKKVAEGEAYIEILNAAEDSYDYIIMGRRGFSKITRFFIGSVTQRVISEAPCPVIVVKE